MSICVAVIVYDESIDLIVKQFVASWVPGLSMLLVNDNPGRVLEFGEAGQIDLIVINNQENLGISGCRNLAIRESKSEFITFLDGDDSLDFNAIASWNSDNKQFDIGYFDYSINLDGFELSSSQSTFRNSWFEIVSSYIRHVDGYGFFPFCWAKIYRRSFILEHDISFTPDWNLFEDIQFLLLMLSARPRIIYIPSLRYKKHDDIMNITRANRLARNFDKILVLGDLIKAQGALRSYACDKDIDRFLAIFAVKRLSQLANYRNLISSKVRRVFADHRVIRGLSYIEVQNQFCVELIMQFQYENRTR